LAVLAIFANIAVPAFDGLITRNRQQALMEQVAAVLNNARAEAILQRRTIEVGGSSEGKTCSASWANGWLVRAPDGRVMQHVQLPSHDDLGWRGFEECVRVHNGGSSAVSNGRCFQCHEQTVAWQLVLNRQGRLRQGSPAENTEKASHGSQCEPAASGALLQ